jgi:hypothetical protein
MTSSPSSYESEIVDAMLRWVAAKARGDEGGMVEALVEAMDAATALKTERRPREEPEGEAS